MNQTEDELIALARAVDSPAARKWLELRDAPEIDDAEAEEILSRMARYNPDAADLLKKRGAS